LVYDEIDSVEL